MGDSNWPADSSQTVAAWEKFRSQLPVTARWAFLDHAAVAPLPEPTRAAIVDWADDTAANGGMQGRRWLDRLEAARRSAAKMIGASPDEIALVRNTTEGITLVAEGYPWRQGDNVVSLVDEFPSNAYPWMNLASRGVETRRVHVEAGRADPGRVAAACDDRTRIVTVSWVNYASGWRNDLDTMAAIAHQAGAALFVDAIQALGVFPLDVGRTPIDFLAADGHKWLLGPEGAGVLFVRREWLDRLRPLGVGWNSVVHSHDYSRIELTLRPSAARYEGGSYPVGGFVGLAASLELLSKYPAAAIAQRLLSLTEVACARLTASGALVYSDRRPEHASGIVSFELPGRSSATVRKHCLRSGVALASRGGRLRISPHVYNNEHDIDRLIAALESCPPEQR